MSLLADPPGENRLGAFLKDRRARLDPASLGIPAVRRRTPGLRREEVAQRAQVSATWYTWLEQGRGGAPSADVLERLSGALELSDTEREHLFLLAQGRPPEARYRPPQGVSPQLQRVLDVLTLSPALVKTSAWDVVAWNAAMMAVFGDYSALAPSQRNILRLMFTEPPLLPRSASWPRDARVAVATFRRETERAGASDSARALVEELSASSADFAAIWRDNDVSAHGEGRKTVQHSAGPITLEYSTFAVDGQADLALVIYTPATSEDLERVKALTAAG